MVDMINQWLNYTQLHKRKYDELEQKLSYETSLSLNEFYILYFLSQQENKKMRLNILEQKVALSQSALSRMIVRMENKKNGLVVRKTCLDDKRGVYIELTNAGKSKLESAKLTMIESLKEEDFK
ncbi:MarR family winged helix-turn-helix transcriptional regulator [Latilactobacillus fuchuensis]|nr:MarR family transcriptional regulator [Latilactobacillus fuchuensis]